MPRSFLMPHRFCTLLLAFAAALAVAAPLALPARAQVSMFADPTARQAGDILTVLLAERTAAQRESEWENVSGARSGGAADITSPTLASRFAVDAQYDTEALSRNQSVQSDLLQGTMTVTVAGVDPAGNLIIQGERQLSVNGETHRMRLAGIVRPYDVRYDNTVYSHQIANAAIEYHRDGGIGRKFFKPGAIARIGLLAVLGAAAFFAL